MKNLILGVALVAAFAACKSQTNASTGDASQPNAGCESACSTEKAGCCTEKAAAKEGCTGEAKVCPATGKTMN